MFIGVFFVEGNFEFLNLKFKLFRLQVSVSVYLLVFFSSHFLGSLSIGDIARGQVEVLSKGAI